MLALHLRRAEALVALLDDEAAKLAVQLGPYNSEVGDGTVGNPHLRTIEYIVISIGNRLRLHTAGVGAMVRFS